MFGVFRSMNSKLGVCGGLDSSVQGHKSTCAKFFGEDYTNSLLEFSDTLKKLAPTLEEIAIMRVILITYTGEYFCFFVSFIKSYKIALME